MFNLETVKLLQTANLFEGGGKYYKKNNNTILQNTNNSMYSYAIPN